MRICRGVSAVALLAALASIALLAVPAVGQPASTTPTFPPPSSTTGFGGSATTSPFGSGVTSPTQAPEVTQTTLPAPGNGGEVGAPGRGAVLILVRRLTWRQVAAIVHGRSETITAGLISTLPADASLSARVLSLAAGRLVDASALAGGADQAAIDRMRAANPDAHFGGLPQVRVAAASGLEDAGLIGLGQTGGPPPVAPLEVTGPPSPAAGELLVVAVPDAAGLQRVLEQLQPGNPAPGGVPDVDAPPAPSRLVIVGLEAPRGRARTAPFVALGGAPGVVTSDSTRRRGLVAYQDLRPTLAGSAAGTDGATIRALPVVDPLGTVGRLDRRVASLVAARSVAIPVTVVIGALALALALLALLLRRGAGHVRGREVLRRLARAVLLVTLALPSGYLIASMVAPLRWPIWLALGLDAGAALALAAWLVSKLPRLPPALGLGRLWRRPAPSRHAKGAAAPAAKAASGMVAPGPAAADDATAVLPAVPPPGEAKVAAAPEAAKEPAASSSSSSPSPSQSQSQSQSPAPPSRAVAAAKSSGSSGVRAVAGDGAAKEPAADAATVEAGSWAAPALLGALIAALIVADLLLGGLALSRPLLGNSAFDGERFYGLGNGYFAHALAGVFLVVAFRQPLPSTAAALLVGLALVDGLPILGADVGGALTAMLTAAAAWLLLRRRRWGRFRVLLVVVGALAIGLAIAFGVGLASGQVSHGARIARELLGDNPSTALRAMRHQLSGNLGLLADNFWAWWGPLLVVFAGVASLRPPKLLAGVPPPVRRAVGVGAIGSLLLIVLNDTGVTAAAGSGLALVATLAWCGLDPSPAEPASPKTEVIDPQKAAEKPVPAKPAGGDDRAKPPSPPPSEKVAASPAPGAPVPPAPPSKTPAPRAPSDRAAPSPASGSPSSKVPASGIPSPADRAPGAPGPAPGEPAPADRGAPGPADRGAPGPADRGAPGPTSGAPDPARTSGESGGGGPAQGEPDGSQNGDQDAGARHQRGARPRRDGPGRR